MEGLIFGILRYYVVNASPLALIKHNSPVFLGVTIQVPEGKGCKEWTISNNSNIFYYVTSHIIADHHLQKAKF